MKTTVVAILLFTSFISLACGPCRDYEPMFTVYGDGDCNCVISTNDFLILLTKFGSTNPNDLDNYDIFTDGVIDNFDAVPWVLNNPGCWYCLDPQPKEVWEQRLGQRDIYEPFLETWKTRYLIWGITWNVEHPDWGYLPDFPIAAMAHCRAYYGAFFNCEYELGIFYAPFEFPKGHTEEIYRFLGFWEVEFPGIITDAFKGPDGFQVIGFLPNCFGGRGYMAHRKVDGTIVYNFFPGNFIPFIMFDKLYEIHSKWCIGKNWIDFAKFANDYVGDKELSLRDIIAGWEFYTWIDFAITADANGNL